MSQVMFATICETCRKRSPEYTTWYHCTECLEDICPDCCVGEPDDETGRSFCHRCKREWEGVTVGGTLYMGMTLEEIIADQHRQRPERLAEMCARLPQERLGPPQTEDGMAKAVLYALIPSLAIWGALWACFKIWRRW